MGLQSFAFLPSKYLLNLGNYSQNKNAFLCILYAVQMAEGKACKIISEKLAILGQPQGPRDKNGRNTCTTPLTRST
jgi:hypothetical protein